ncbi:hypothetical protein ABTK75_18825, partial [Acinetobacter baumannii]
RGQSLPWDRWTITRQSIMPHLGPRRRPARNRARNSMPKRAVRRTRNNISMTIATKFINAGEFRFQGLLVVGDKLGVRKQRTGFYFLGSRSGH